jgi:chromosome segregation ATPase
LYQLHQTSLHDCKELVAQLHDATASAATAQRGLDQQVRRLEICESQSMRLVEERDIVIARVERMEAAGAEGAAEVRAQQRRADELAEQVQGLEEAGRAASSEGEQRLAAAVSAATAAVREELQASSGATASELQGAVVELSAALAAATHERELLAVKYAALLEEYGALQEKLAKDSELVGDFQAELNAAKQSTVSQLAACEAQRAELHEKYSTAVSMAQQQQQQEEAKAKDSSSEWEVRLAKEQEKYVQIERQLYEQSARHTATTAALQAEKEELQRNAHTLAADLQAAQAQLEVVQTDAMVAERNLSDAVQAKLKCSSELSALQASASAGANQLPGLRQQVQK